MASSSAVVSYGSRSSGLENNQKRKSNLQITFNMGEGFMDCDKCQKTIKDYLCVCKKCRKNLHPHCAGVEIQTRLSDRDGSKYIKLPALEDLPLSCPDCLPNQLAGSSQSQLQEAGFSSITSALGSSNVPADEHMIFLIHESSSTHELIMQNEKGAYTCFGCKQKGFGPHHACRNKSCHKIRFHEECKSLRLTRTHPFFPRLRFDFCSKPLFIKCESKNCKTKQHSDTSCNACGMYANGYFYRSQDDEHHLHPCCANLPQQIKCRNTGATMVLKQKTTSKCYYCKEIKVKRGIEHTDEVWSYVSESDNFHLHVGCIIKMLSDLKDDLGDNNHSRLLTLHKNVSNGVPEANLQIAIRADTQKKWEKRFEKFMKYAKIALGAVISIFFGDPSTLITSVVLAVIQPNN